MTGLSWFWLFNRPVPANMLPIELLLFKETGGAALALLSDFPAFRGSVMGAAPADKLVGNLGAFPFCDKLGEAPFKEGDEALVAVPLVDAAAGLGMYLGAVLEEIRPLGAVRV